MVVCALVETINGVRVSIDYNDSRLNNYANRVRVDELNNLNFPLKQDNQWKDQCCRRQNGYSLRFRTLLHLTICNPESNESPMNLQDLAVEYLLVIRLICRSNIKLCYTKASPDRHIQSMSSHSQCNHRRKLTAVPPRGLSIESKADKNTQWRQPRQG